MTENSYSIAVLPFLKTSSPVTLGGITFRSTNDISNLPVEQARSVGEIADMLFLKDDLRIKTASYAIVPYVDMDSPMFDVSDLVNVQAVIAYLYASPHEVFGDLFLSSEHASMILFSPGRVPFSLVRPNFHVIATGAGATLPADEWGNVSGYSGIYNFRHHFWVAVGSRLYGPAPHLTLNRSQDLSVSLERASRHQHHFQLLLKLLNQSKSSTAARIFTAIRWYNYANRRSNTDEESLVNLAIAFESLLGLPDADKTNRLVDTIALLLGRMPRLDIWAQQFYDARSRIVHEGQTDLLHFIASDSRKKTEGQEYQPLLSYGRQIFRLCLGTLLTGLDMATRANLEDRLVTNQERFAEICKTLSDKTLEPCERLVHIQPIVESIDRYRFVAESGLQLATLIGATRLAAKTLVDCEDALPQELKAKIDVLLEEKRTEDHFGELQAIRRLEEVLPDNAAQADSQYIAITCKIVEVVWNYVYMHYFWLREQKLKSSTN